MNYLVQSFPDYLKKLQRLHRGSVIFQIVFIFLMFLFPIGNETIEGGILTYLLVTGIPFLIIRIMHRVQLRKAIEITNLSKRLNAYNGVFLSFVASCHGPAFFAFAFGMITGDITLSVISVCILVYFITQKPSKETIIKDLKLTPQEAEELEKL
jgi:hypothetical protein